MPAMGFSLTPRGITKANISRVYLINIAKLKFKHFFIALSIYLFLQIQNLMIISNNVLVNVFCIERMRKGCVEKIEIISIFGNKWIF